MDISSNYLFHLNEIRKVQGMRTMDFISDVCSERQFRRYLNGSNIIPQERFELLCQKVGMSALDFYISFHGKEDQEYKKVSTLYKQIQYKNWHEVRLSIDSLTNYKFNNPFTEKYFHLCTIIYRYETNDIAKYYANDLLKKIVDYKSIFERSVYTFVEITALLHIAFISTGSGDNKPLDLLENILSNRASMYVSSNSNYVLPALYAEVSRLNGMLGNLEKALNITNLGIEYCTKIGDFSTLPEIYYYNSLCHFKLGYKHEAMKWHSYVYQHVS